MSLRRRSAVLASGILLAGALAGVAIASTPAARAPAQSDRGRSGVRAGPGASRRASAAGPCEAVGLKADLRSASGSTASPWTPLKNPPPFGTPGTMLLESDGTVLVHNEPDNNATGGTNEWWKLTPAPDGSYIDGTWSQIASMSAAYTPLYFASAILPDGRMIVEGGEYIGENAVWSNEGAIYNPVTTPGGPSHRRAGWTNMGTPRAMSWPTAPSCSSSRARPASRIRI